MALKTLDELNRDFMYDRLLNVKPEREDLFAGFYLDLEEERFISGAAQKLTTAFQTLKSFAGLRNNREKF
jgi:hypothetical protein